MPSGRRSARIAALAACGVLGLGAASALAQDDPPPDPPPPDPPPAPTVSITDGPAAATRTTTATFSFAATDATSLTCWVDDGPEAPCTSPRSVTVANGPHVFNVRATGETAPPATAARGWTVDTAAPAAPTILAPAANAFFKERAITFSGEPGVTYECWVDINVPVPCTSPFSLEGVFDGAHFFSVRARDAVGAGPAASVHATLDTVAPTATFHPPADLERSATPAIGLGASEDAVTFACAVDEVAAPCATLWDTVTLAPGAHELRVTATDRAANAGPPAVLSWTYRPPADPPRSDPPPVVPPTPSPTPPVVVTVVGPPGTTATATTGGGPSPTATITRAPSSQPAPKVAATPMVPFPVVRLAGELLDGVARIRVLTVTAPRAARIDVSCRGRGCPRTSGRVPAARRSAAVSVRWLAGARLRTGAVVEIRVTQEGRIGKYTRFRIRRGAAPQRRDLCLRPGAKLPVPCA